MEQPGGFSGRDNGGQSSVEASSPTMTFDELHLLIRIVGDDDQGGSAEPISILHCLRKQLCIFPGIGNLKTCM